MAKAMADYLDARGDACPLPVIKTRKALKLMDEGELVVAVDNKIATENLEKMVNELGYGVSVTSIDEKHYEVSIRKAANEEKQSSAVAKKTLAVISSNKMGDGDDTLGKTLMKAFLYSLSEAENPPPHIVFYNSGAFLTCEDSDSLADLRALEARGVCIETCGACLNFYELSEKLAIGTPTNMYKIVEAMLSADSVVKP